MAPTSLFLCALALLMDFLKYIDFLVGELLILCQQKVTLYHLHHWSRNEQQQLQGDNFGLQQAFVDLKL